jgi:hypothetical protein
LKNIGDSNAYTIVVIRIYWDGITITAGPQSPKGDTGANGATGPQGLPGSTGLQGPPGIRNVNASNYYSVIGNGSTSRPPVSSFTTSTASGLPGDVAISGEYNITFAVLSTPPGLYLYTIFW